MQVTPGRAVMQLLRRIDGAESGGGGGNFGVNYISAVLP